MPAIDTTDMKLRASLPQAKGPNKDTLKAMVELDDGKGEKHNSISSLMASLNADD